MLAEKYNLLNLISSVKDCLKAWKYRGLTLGRRIQILKSLVLSEIVYIGTMIDVPKQFIEQLNSLQEDFIWNGRRPKIRHSTLIADYVEGGYKDIDIKTKLSSLKVIWIKELMDDNFHAWKAIPMAWLSNNGSIQIFNANFKLSQCLLDKLSYLPHFYRELTLFWENGSHTKPDDVSEILKQIYL